jgi:hypothetical protein
LGFVLTGLSAIGVVVPSAGLHAWMVGAAGMMTLAVMTRATLGHTGHELVASVSTQFIYAAVFIAAIARICAAIGAVLDRSPDCSATIMLALRRPLADARALTRGNRKGPCRPHGQREQPFATVVFPPQPTRVLR